MELLHRRCCGLDVHKETVVACLRIVSDGKVTREVRTFQTTTADLLRLSEWLAVNGCTHVAMEATGIYWKPVWHILDDGEFELVLANAAHVKNVPGRKSDVSDATWVTELLAHGLIRASFVPNAQTQEMRNLLRTRHHDLGCDHFKRHSTDQQKKHLVKRLSDLGFAVEPKPLVA
jgi:transposase